MNSSRLSTLNWYSLNSSSKLGITFASGFPLLLAELITLSPKPSPSVSSKLSNPGNGLYFNSVSVPSALINWYKTLKSAEESLNAVTKTLN